MFIITAHKNKLTNWFGNVKGNNSWSERGCCNWELLIVASKLLGPAAVAVDEGMTC